MTETTENKFDETTAEETSTDEETLDEDETSTDEYDKEEDAEDEEWFVKLKKEEHEALIKKLAKAEKKLWKWYKKSAESKANFITKENLREFLEKVDTDKKSEAELVEKFDDAKELLPEIRKISSEKWLSIDEAYWLVKHKMLADEWYRNQINEARTTTTGTMKKNGVDTTFAKVFSQWPSRLTK